MPWGSYLHSHTVLGVSGRCSGPVREETDLWVNFLEKAVQLTVAVHAGSQTPTHVDPKTADNGVPDVKWQSICM